MLKTFIKLQITLYILGISLLSGCVSLDSATQPEVAEHIKLAYQTALISMKKGKYKLAIKQFNKIIKQQPGLAGPHTNLGIIYLKKKSLDKARQSLEKAIELNKQSTIAYNHLGIVYRNMGRFDDAEQAYLKAIEINTSYDYAHLNLGILYDLYKSDGNKAINHYQQYLKLSNKPDKMVEKWIVDIQRQNKTAASNAKETPG
ncbi:MAG: tetratricopeptide repeat protein [Gammaproteobacteria bacterium]|nr:tetratricopeptide repeat protein [Gammaproteobacteria bacterium]